MHGVYHLCRHQPHLCKLPFQAQRPAVTRHARFFQHAHWRLRLLSALTCATASLLQQCHSLLVAGSVPFCRVVCLHAGEMSGCVLCVERRCSLDCADCMFYNTQAQNWVQSNTTAPSADVAVDKKSNEREASESHSVSVGDDDTLDVFQGGEMVGKNLETAVDPFLRFQSDMLETKFTKFANARDSPPLLLDF